MGIEDFTRNEEEVKSNLERASSTVKRPEDEEREDNPYMPGSGYKRDEYPAHESDKEEYFMPRAPDLSSPSVSQEEDLKYSPFISTEEEPEKEEEEVEEEEPEEEEEGE